MMSLQTAARLLTILALTGLLVFVMLLGILAAGFSVMFLVN